MTDLQMYLSLSVLFNVAELSIFAFAKGFV